MTTSDSHRPRNSSGLRILEAFTAVAFLTAFVVGCGGGGGGGGSAQFGASGGTGSGISLLSITFPEYTDLSGGSTVPPLNAPLSQQIVLTFSGAVQGEVTSGGLQITADPGLDYLGPDVALDSTKNLLVARGDYEVMNNLVIFTPFIPTGSMIDLSQNGELENVPGLLPGYTYRIFVPVGSEGSIQNLVNIDAAVGNPVQFTTGAFESVNYSFRNQPALPPEVIALDPADGVEDFPFNTYSDLSQKYGLPAPSDIVATFDQPLDFRTSNMEGKDLDGDGVRDQNIFLKYTGSDLISAVDRSETQLGYLARLNAKDDSFEFIGFTNYEGLNVGLKSVLFLRPLTMLGCSGRALYDVPFESPSGSAVALANERKLDLDTELKGLAVIGKDELYAVDIQGISLFRIAVETGAVTVKGVLSPAGNIEDLAVGFDGELYALRVFNRHTPYATASIERINRSTLICTPIVTGLSGDFSSFGFTGSRFVTLFDTQALQIVSIDLMDVTQIVRGEPVTDPQLNEGRNLDFDMKRYELGVTPVLLDNSYHGATVRIDPSGILPIDAWIDVMIRHSLENISGGSKYKNLGYNPLGALSVGCFKTYDPGEAAIEDEYIEHFLDNDMEEPVHAFSNARALWNVQDADGVPPHYSHLLAAIGLSGGGELGDFIPIGISPTIFLDTNYQSFPLFDGSTPDITTPVVVTNGEFHFRDIIIPENVTVKAQGTNPLVFTSTGTVDIAGTIDVSGQRGGIDVTFNSAYVPTPGGKGGPGGGRGGMGQPPVPPDFGSLTQLQSVKRAERGWGPGDKAQIGGQGGESGADGPGVPWTGSKTSNEHRGAGGGGGSFFEPGHDGYPGFGRYTVDADGNFVVRDPWSYWDGTYEYDASWTPGDPKVKANIYSKDDVYGPNDHPFNLAPKHGVAGNAVFVDVDEFGELNVENDFLGETGELKVLQGGQGGGGGGSRLDSMNPNTIAAAAGSNPPLAPSAFDGKGGGGGGGGGALAIHCLGKITVRKTGRILASGGRGGGGEVIGMCQMGGGGGGGSGGAIVLNSATGIELEYQPGGAYAILDVSGGLGADARGNIGVDYDQIPDTCSINTNSGILRYDLTMKFCSWSRGDGGWGGYGMIQLMVPDPAEDLVMKGWPNGYFASVEATTWGILGDPDVEKQKVGLPSTNIYYSYYDVTPSSGGPPYEKVIPLTTDCLVPPEKTISTISALTYGVSKWIDMGRVMDRPLIGGKIAPVFREDDPLAFYGFRGVSLGDDNWAQVKTTNHYVVNGHLPIGDPASNDIEVDAPDLYLEGYIPGDNKVEIQFQGTDAKVPGSKVPDLDPSLVNEDSWTYDLASLHGKQFIRFRVRLDVANGGAASPSSPKPQVNYVRLRFKY